MANYAHVIDYALLKPGGTLDEFYAALDVALKQTPRGFCVNPDVLDLVVKNRDTERAFSDLRRKGVLRQFVVDFPHGRGGVSAKITVPRRLFEYADEFDVVANVGALLDDDKARFVREIKPLVDLGKPVKVIVETGHYPDDVEVLERAVHWCAEVGAFAIKTSTGFEPKVENEKKRQHVRLWKRLIGDSGYNLKIKLSGGQKTADDVDKALGAGADIIGASTVEFT